MEGIFAVVIPSMAVCVLGICRFAMNLDVDSSDFSISVKP